MSKAGDDRSISVDRGDVIGSTVVSGDGNIVVVQAAGLVREEPRDQRPLDGMIGPNPYKGLLAFHEQDADQFFGREELTDRLWQLFRERHDPPPHGQSPMRLLPVLGPSGSGKSSVVRAGLIPELARRPLPGWKKARVAVLIPGSHPLEALAAVLAQIVTGDPAPVKKTREFIDELKIRTAEGQCDGLRRIAASLPEIASLPLIVLVDQFEEIYSLCADADERKSFVDNLLCAVTDPATNVSAIITLRTDFLDETQKHPQLNAAIAGHGALIPAMNEDELRRAIGEPAKLAGRPLDEATVDLLIHEAEGRDGALPLLQFALTRIWDGLINGVEPADTLKEIGGVGGALAGEAQRIYENLPDDEKNVARRVFLGLVQLGEGTRDTRRRVVVASLVAVGEDRDQVEEVIHRFSAPGVRLITLSAESDGRDTAEVTHEALFEHWRTLDEWLAGSRDDLRFQRRLDLAARHWESQQRAEGLLWRPPDLELLSAFHERASDATWDEAGDSQDPAVAGRTLLRLTPLQMDFFIASRLAEKKRIAEEEKQQRLRRTLLRVAAVTGVVATLLFVASTVLYFRMRGAKTTAEQETKKAVDAEAREKQQRVDAVKARIAAVDAKDREEEQRIAAETARKEEEAARQLAERELFYSSISLAAREWQAGDVNRAVGLLNICPRESRDWAWSYIKGQTRLDRLTFFGSHTHAINAVAFDPSGTRIVAASDDGQVTVHDASTGSMVHDFTAHSKAATAVLFTQAKEIVSASADGSFQLRDGTTGKIRRKIRAHPRGVKDLAVAGTTLATAGDDGVKLWNLKSGAPLGSLEVSSVTCVAFHPDGKRLATGCATPDRRVRIWNTESGKQFHLMADHLSNILDVEFSADGQFLASTCYDKILRIWNVETGALVNTVVHNGIIVSVAYSPDGRWLATAGHERLVRIWDLTTGKTFIWRGHSGRITSLAFNSDGNRLVSASADGIVKVWDMTRRPEMRVIPFSPEMAACEGVAVSADGKLVASLGNNGTAKVWTLVDGNEQRTFALGEPGSTRGMSTGAIAFSHFGTHLAATSSDGSVGVWDASSGDEVFLQSKFLPPGNAARNVNIAFSPDDKRVLVSDRKGKVHVLGAGTGKEESSYQNRWAGTTASTTFSPDGRFFCSAGMNRIRVADALKGNEIESLSLPAGLRGAVTFGPKGRFLAESSGTQASWNLSVWDRVARNLLYTTPSQSSGAISFSPDGKRIASMGSVDSVDNTVTIRAAETGRELLTLPRHSSLSPGAAWTPDARTLVASGWDGLRVWSTSDEDELEVFTFVRSTGIVTGLAFNPDGRRIASASKSTVLWFWDTLSGAVAAVAGDLEAPPFAVAFSPDGSRLATTHHDGSVVLWDAETVTKLWKKKLLKPAPVVAFSPDPNGRLLAVACQDETARLFETESGDEVLKFTGHGAMVNGVAFSPDGTRVASCSRSKDATAKIWDVCTGEVRLTLGEHPGSVAFVAFSPDGHKIATCGGGGTGEEGYVYIWDAKKGERLLEVPGHKDFVYCVSFDPNSRYVATACEDSVVRILDAATGEALRAFRGHFDFVLRVAFSPDGSLLASCGGDKTVRVWDLSCLPSDSNARQD